MPRIKGGPELFRGRTFFQLRRSHSTLNRMVRLAVTAIFPRARVVKLSKGQEIR